MSNVIVSYRNLTLLLSIAGFITLFSCKKEGEIGDEQKESFVKFHGTSSYDQCFDLKETSDGGFVMLGNTTDPNNGTEISLIKTDDFGNLVWHRKYGRAGNDEGKGFEITADGGFIITGFLTNTDSATGDDLDRDIYIIKTDADGNLIWESILGDTLVNEEGRSIVITPFGYAVGTIVETGAGNNVIVYQIDNNGNPFKISKSEGQVGEDIINKALLVNGDVILLGSSQSGEVNRTNLNVFYAKFNLKRK